MGRTTALAARWSHWVSVFVAVAGARMPTGRSTGCLAAVGNDLYYSGGAYAQSTVLMRALEKISGTAGAPTATPTYAPWSRRHEAMDGPEGAGDLLVVCVP